MYSRSLSPCRICSGAWASPSRVRSPTGSAHCAFCAAVRLLYAIGLVLMAYSTSPLTLNLTVGVLIGFGLSGCSFNLVVAALGKLVPEHMRSMAFGAGTAAGSFGQFLFAPLGAALIDNYGWAIALFVFAAAVMLVLPFSIALATAPSEKASNATLPMRRNRSARRCAKPSAIAPMCCWCSASSPAGSSSRSSPRICRRI